MNTRRRLAVGAAVIAAAAMVLASGCSSATSGSAERGGSVSGPVSDTAGGTASSMTQPSDEAPTATGSDTAPDSATGDGDVAASSETPTAATETTSGDAAGSCPDAASWTTADETTDLAGNAPILEVGADVADCYDRFVITLGPGAHEAGYRVRYVDTVIEDGSGRVVELAGAASLEVIVDSPAYDPETGRGTLQIPDHNNVVDVSGFDALQQVAYAGSFEGQTTFGIGVTAELPFAVTTGVDDAGNATLTIAVAHG
jgi:hypothetical protein